jgi:hypothetical protein|tara:strand:+ start:64 stop:462 length:399 start_codon:yes stop_codon:yes gene_type:complete
MPSRKEYYIDYRKKLRDINTYEDITIRWLNYKIARVKRQKKSDVSFTLTAKQLLELIPRDLKCPVFKTKFTFGRDNLLHNLSLDRIDNNKGYEKDNVVVVSVRANTMKSSGTVKEMYQVADFYYELERKLHD